MTTPEQGSAGVSSDYELSIAVRSIYFVIDCIQESLIAQRMKAFA